MSTYYAFRYSVIDLPQASLFSPEDKNAWMSKFLHESLSERGYIQYNTDDLTKKRNYIISYYDEYEEIVICKFARNAMIKRHVFYEDRKDIIEESTVDNPFIILIFDTSRQIVFFEKNTRIFSLDSAVNILMGLLNSLFKVNGIKISIKPLLIKDTFWAYIKQLDKIYSIEFELGKPNNLEEFMQAEELFDSLENAMNADTVNFGVHNDLGELKPDKDILGSLVDYSENGSGSYKVRGAIKGEEKIFLSEEESNIRTIKFDLEKNSIHDVANRVLGFRDIIKKDRG